MEPVDSIGHVTSDGRLILEYPDKFKRELKSLSGYAVRVIVEPEGKRRSNEENRYYWGVIVHNYRLLAYDSTGEYYSTDLCHELLKLRCNPIEKYNEELDRMVTVGGSTKRMSTTAFENYLERCRAHILEVFGYVVPLPNEEESEELNLSEIWSQ